MAEEAASKRAAGLAKLFGSVIHGHRQLNSASDGNRFLEALYTQENVSNCVECLVASSMGLAAVAKSFRFSGERAFLNGPATSFIQYLSEPSLRQLYGGQFLHRVVEQIVQPPTFWNTFVEAHGAHTLTPEGALAFAWLLLETLHIRSGNIPDVRDVAERITKNEQFINSDSPEVRRIGHKIKNILETTGNQAEGGPGGRHDNDFADYRKIKLLPTPDEFASTEIPFYQRADSIPLVEPENRALAHLDNQFRLVREDLLGELRSDFQVATSQRKGRRKLVLGGLQLEGIDCGPLKRRKPCLLKLRCKDDLPQLRGVKDVVVRKKILLETKNVMKHMSFGCLVSGANIVAFTTVDRDENLLAQRPPVVLFRVNDAESFGKVLMVCKTASDLRYFQVDTSFFAYEPILKCLQSMTELPLEEQLLRFTPSSAGEESGIQPHAVLNAIRKGWQDNIQHIVGASQPIQLDLAQVESLLAGLSKKVSLVQGPPGASVSCFETLELMRHGQFDLKKTLEYVARTYWR